MAAGTWTLLCIAVVLIALIVRRRLRFVAAFRNIAGPPSLPILGNALQLNGTPAGKSVTFAHQCKTSPVPSRSLFLLILYNTAVADSSFDTRIVYNTPLFFALLEVSSSLSCSNCS
jgi:hypothetical protein